MTKIYVVANQMGGYAREDSPVTSVVGAYTDPDKAEIVRKVSGYGAKVTVVEIDFIPPGLVEYATVLGFKL